MSEQGREKEIARFIYATDEVLSLILKKKIIKTHTFLKLFFVVYNSILPMLRGTYEEQFLDCEIIFPSKTPHC